MSVASGRNRFGLFILLRRLRYPLAVVVLVYAVAVFGFTLVPGIDAAGQPWRMGFLHAFYFVSFLGTTIGLGEIPQPFSDAQRLWATASIYATVTAWLYGIGAQILRSHGVGKMRLMASPRKMPSMTGFGLEICGYLTLDGKKI